MLGPILSPGEMEESGQGWLGTPWMGRQTPLSTNISAKPSDPAADVLFAFALYCFHTNFLEALRAEGLLEHVQIHGMCISSIAGEQSQSVSLGVPPVHG